MRETRTWARGRGGAISGKPGPTLVDRWSGLSGLSCQGQVPSQTSFRTRRRRSLDSHPAYPLLVLLQLLFREVPALLDSAESRLSLVVAQDRSSQVVVRSIERDCPREVLGDRLEQAEEEGRAGRVCPNTADRRRTVRVERDAARSSVESQGQGEVGDEYGRTMSEATPSGRRSGHGTSGAKGRNVGGRLG